MIAHYVPEHATIAHDEMGSIVVSTIVDMRVSARATSIMGFETAIKAGAGSFTVVATFDSEQGDEALAAHALLVEQLGAMM